MPWRSAQFAYTLAVIGSGHELRELESGCTVIATRRGGCEVSASRVIAVVVRFVSVSQVAACTCTRNAALRADDPPCLTSSLGGALPTTLPDGLVAMRLPGPSPYENCDTFVVEVDPELCQIVVIPPGVKSRTAMDWSEEFALDVAINSGMFASDWKSHEGLMRVNHREHSPPRDDYQSAMVLNPVNGAGPPFEILDLSETPESDLQVLSKRYGTILQNLRLIKRPGENRWSPSEKVWSEAALAINDEGHALFVLSEAPVSMYEFNNYLMESDLNVVAAQHLEGGPPAQISIRTPSQRFQRVGLFETGFDEVLDRDSAQAWELPSVIGARCETMRVPSSHRAGN